MTPEKGVKEDLGRWLPLLESYRLRSLPHDLLVVGRLRPDLDAAGPELADALDGWPHPVHLHADPDGVEVALVLPQGPEKTRWWLHAILLVLTFVTTLSAGALLAGVDPFRTRFLEWGQVVVPYPTRLRLGVLPAGITFAVPFLGVLLAHEMGHWAAARRHGIRASLPYFIPFPPYLSIIGTLGAFIRLRGATIRRVQLLDVGASGPLLSFALSLPLVMLGFAWSTPVAGSVTGLTPYVVDFAGTPVWLGEGLLTALARELVAPTNSVPGPLLLHPVAFAGWLGLFVTALNLLPMGQLDGGHILFALLGRRQHRIGRLFVLALIPLGTVWWGWWAWAALVVVVHRGRVAHPSVVQPEPPVTGVRRIVGWVAVVIFFLTFVPVPLALS